jgi:membrane-associated phospholipid phosphatase
MNARDYWSGLTREHQHALATSSGPDALDRNLNLLLAAVCGLTTGILFAAGGYHVGFDAVYRVGTHLPGALITVLVKPGETLAAICLIAFFARRRPAVMWMGVLATIYAALLTHTLKTLLHAVRPTAVLGDWVTVTGPVLRAYSFPSGHTVTAFLLAACLSVAARGRIRFAWFALAAIVGTSRVWIGAHWPVDVIAGAGIGGLSVALAVQTMRITHRGMGPIGHACCVLLIAACAVAESALGAAGTLSGLLHVGIATTALALLARDYVVGPLLAGRAGIHGLTPASAKEAA